MYPENVAKQTRQNGKIKFYLVKEPLGHFCGYAKFAKRPVRERGYNGILTWAPVHGGITYAEERKDGSMVYGFDCTHAGDESNPKCEDKAWLMAECERMALSIKAVVKYEKDYLLCRSEKQKAKIIDKYHKELRMRKIADFVLTDNFGAMLNCLSGRV